LHARFGTLDGFAPQSDGNVALAGAGEVGDVMMRTEHDYAASLPSYWVLYEDPGLPYPIPVKPQVPADLLPDFKWPGPNAELRFIHYDYEATEPPVSEELSDRSISEDRCFESLNHPWWAERANRA